MYNVGTALTNPTAQRFFHGKMADTEDAEIPLPYIAAVISLIRKAPQEE